MPILTPTEDESQSDFVSRCMASDVMRSEFPDQAQRSAVCHDAFRGKSIPSEEIKLDISQVRRICAPCAGYMDAKGITEITLADLIAGWQKQNDANRICGDIWFNGPEGQRESFAGGTQGRGRDEQPPRAWWADCLLRVGT